MVNTIEIFGCALIGITTALLLYTCIDIYYTLNSVWVPFWLVWADLDSSSDHCLFCGIHVRGIWLILQ